MLKFGSADLPKLTKHTLESVAVDTFIKYLHQLIRADAFDDSVINLIDSETAGLLTYCDITAHTVLLYVLFCLTYMYFTLCTLYH